NATPAVTASMMRIGSAVVRPWPTATSACNSKVIKVKIAAASDTRMCVRSPAGLRCSSRSRPTTAPTVTAISMRSSASHGAMRVASPANHASTSTRFSGVESTSRRHGSAAEHAWSNGAATRSSACAARPLRRIGATTVGIQPRWPANDAIANLWPIMARIRIALAILALPVMFVALAPLGVSARESRDAFAEARAAFLRSYEQAEKSAEPQQPDSETLRTYPLYPYLQAARIRRSLASVAAAEAAAVDERAHTFVTYYEGEPVGRNVRRFWLESLAKRNRWELFLDQYRANVADDALQCMYFTARIELGRTEDLALDVAAQWLTPRSLPDCRRAFDWLREQRHLTPALIEQRVRRALEANNVSFARQIAAMRPDAQAAPFRQWADLLQHPRREIDALIANPARTVSDEALLAGWSRLARADRDAAMARFQRLIAARKLTEQAASPYALALALPLAWSRRSEALEYFSMVQPHDLDDYALERRGPPPPLGH